MKFVLFVLFLISTAAQAAPENLSSYKAITCKVSKVGGKETAVKFDKKLTPLIIEDHAGLFAEMKANVGSDEIQLQVLLEDDEIYNGKGYVLFLVNLKVNGKESSTEFAGQKVNFLKASNEGYSATCEF